VLAPSALVPALSAALGAPGPEEVDERGATDLASAVVVSTVDDAKGLEFDAVVLADPEGVLGASPRGLNDLYVALTRATRSLVVVHRGRLPGVLQRLDQGSPDAAQGPSAARAR
jgi:superfamily I DNA/RNA helicase